MRTVVRRTAAYQTITPTPASMTDWRELSLCGREEPDLFFPIGVTGAAKSQALEAKRVCWRCQVRTQCLEWALEVGIRDGVWGGLDEDERKALARDRGGRRPSRSSGRRD